MDCEYLDWESNYVQQKPVKMSCASTQFQELSFCGPYTKPHGMRRLSKNCHL